VTDDLQTSFYKYNSLFHSNKKKKETTEFDPKEANLDLDHSFTN